MSVTLLNPERLQATSSALKLPLPELTGAESIALTPEQYKAHFDRLLYMEKQYDNLSIFVRDDLVSNMLVYIKGDKGAMMINAGKPVSGFISTEQGMVRAFWAYSEGTNGRMHV